MELAGFFFLSRGLISATWSKMKTRMIACHSCLSLVLTIVVAAKPIEKPAALKLDHWTMIYSEGLADQHLAIASSPDLIEWKLEGPIEIPRQKWMSRKFGAPFIWREPDGDQLLKLAPDSPALKAGKGTPGGTWPAHAK